MSCFVINVLYCLIKLCSQEVNNLIIFVNYYVKMLGYVFEACH